MSQGEAYGHIHLLDEKGKEVELPFLVLDEELWDHSGTRLTLFIDPGRIKRGVKPREDVGPSLEAGKRFSLVIDRDWADAEGRPLVRAFRKEFLVGPPDVTQPTPKEWKVVAPVAGSKAPLVVEFPEPLDHAELGRVLRVTDEAGREIAGRVTIGAKETRWCFTPESRWNSAPHRIAIATILEDLAGNSIARPFEVDVLDTITQRVEIPTVRLSFRPLPKGAAD